MNNVSIAPAPATTPVCMADCLPVPALSAFRLVMLEISSSDALISSHEAACSLAPSASA